VEKRGYGYAQNAAEEYNCCSKRNYTFGARLVTSAFLPKPIIFDGTGRLKKNPTVTIVDAFRKKPQFHGRIS
jgi:hypothetical protein